MKRFIIPILLIIFFAFGSFFWWRQNSRPVSTSGDQQSFLIPKGYSASQIGNKLADQNLIKSSLAFKFYVQVTARSKKIQAGEYLLASNYSLFKIVDQLTSGPVEEWVTIPEGLRQEEVVEKYISVLKNLGCAYVLSKMIGARVDFDVKLGELNVTKVNKNIPEKVELDILVANANQSMKMIGRHIGYKKVWGGSG